MKLRTPIAAAAVAALVLMPTTAASASTCDHSPASTTANSGTAMSDSASTRSAMGLTLRIDRVKPRSGQVKFTVIPAGFTYVKVSDDGIPAVAGQGHAHIYAKDSATDKVRYIGWTGSGLTDLSDAGRLKAGRTYRVFAVFSQNDHEEVWSIRSKAVTVTMR